MKSSKENFSFLPNIHFFLLLFFAIVFNPPSSKAETSPTFTTSVLTNLSGNIWVEDDNNFMYNGEPGPSGVRVMLYDNDEDTLVTETLTVDGKYEFNNVGEGKYHLRIAQSAFSIDGPLFGLQSCPGTNDANDMVDDDDNGSDTAPDEIFCSPFNLTDTDPMNNVSVEYIDFCFVISCDQPNPIAVPSCSDILVEDIVCDLNDLDNLCATMPADSSGGTQPAPLCDGFNTSENISWFAFTAAEGNYSINIIPFDCEMISIGQEGIQVGVYTDCSFSEAVFCSEQCTGNPVSIGSNVFNPGQVYYLYINGCNGNVCTYQININGTATVPILAPDDVCVLSDGAYQCTDIDYCLNDDIVFNAQGLTLSGNYTWSVTTISGEEYQGDSIVQTTENELVINVATEGTYQICLTTVSNSCDMQSWSGAVCREVTTTSSIPVPMDEDFGEFFVCEGELETFSINTLLNLDPNGDGVSGWNAPLPDNIEGINQGTASVDGCSYEQQFTLGEYPPTPVADVLITVCNSDLPLQIDALTITSFIFGGQQTVTFENHLLVNSTDQYGCDSIVNLTIERLNILQGGLFPPVCTESGIDLEFNYIEDLSTDIEYLTFVWTDPQGDTLDYGSDPTTVTAPFDSGNGQYALDITIDKNGTTCEYTFTTFVDIALYLPNTPVVSGPTVICEGEMPVLYVAEFQDDETEFLWSYPNDVASAAITGISGDTLTIDWTGSTGGNISVIAQNICGQSNPSSFDVEIIPKANPNFSLDTSICVDNITTVTFQGSNFNIASFHWDFDGGSIISGIGMGPYEISWNEAGQKTVSLFTTDLNSCVSNTTSKSIEVKFPLEPTEVMCFPGVGEVLFTWEIPLNVSGFEVNVLSGQTGGVFLANSFSIDGLDEEEEVTIELLTMPDDPICGEYVSTFISCTSLSCVPPTIELTADQALCVDDNNITIDASITSGETGTGIFTGPGIINATTGEFDPSLANIGQNTIVYTFTSDIADCIGSKTITIEVFDTPEANFVQSADTFCITDQVVLTYTGTPNADNYIWDFDGGSGSGLLTNQTVVYDSPGLKNISLQVVKDGCESEVSNSSILVDAELEEINIQCDTSNVDRILFSWNSIPGVSLYEIRVDNGPPFFTPLTSVLIDELDPEQTITITVTAMSASTCPGSSSSISCTTKMVVDVDETFWSTVSIFPNPVEDFLYVEGALGRQLSFDLYSFLGQRMMSGSDIQRTIDLSALPSGVYFLKIGDSSLGEYSNFRVVKR